jgi:hypothetical protein
MTFFLSLLTEVEIRAQFCLAMGILLSPGAQSLFLNKLETTEDFQ